MPKRSRLSDDAQALTAGGGAHQEDVVHTMATILGTMLTLCIALLSLQAKKQRRHEEEDPALLRGTPPSSFLPCPISQRSKYAYEVFVACYSPVWIVSFVVIVVWKLYQQFTALTYLFVLVGLALPLLSQPILLPSALLNSPDAQRPLLQRYAFKANLWIAIYSFIGNYWYTHYFYSVLKAKYTMPSHRFNNVPLPLYFATHFYFSTYHVGSNCILRKVVTTYQPGALRTLLFSSVVVCFAYLTAFMETLTISSYPDYSFQDRNMAYTVGSAFYGIYFLVSFPAFFHFDDQVDIPKRGGVVVVTAWDTVVSSCGYGMMIMFLLDFVRLYLGIPLVLEIWKEGDDS